MANKYPRLLCEIISILVSHPSGLSGKTHLCRSGPLPPVKKVAAAQNSLKENIGQEEEGLEKFCHDKALKSVRRGEGSVAGWEN